jgi:hypothetical protein
MTTKTNKPKKWSNMPAYRAYLSAKIAREHLEFDYSLEHQHKSHYALVHAIQYLAEAMEQITRRLDSK